MLVSTWLQLVSKMSGTSDRRNRLAFIFVPENKFWLSPYAELVEIPGC